jgi:hypothetical protein
MPSEPLSIDPPPPGDDPAPSADEPAPTGSPPASPKGVGRIGQIASELVLPLALVVGLVLSLPTLQAVYPIQKWLFWRYAAYWLCALVFCAACLSAGHAVVRRVVGTTLPTLEHVAVSFATGVYVFFLAMFAGGLLKLYGTPFFLGLPLALIAAFGRGAYRYARRWARHVRHARRDAPRAPLWTYPVVGFGLVSLALVYVAILPTDHVSFDARWQHLAIAEQYKALGGIERFPEGWSFGAGPHLASVLYAWAFLLPGGRLFDRIGVASHLELATFVFTLVGISALSRALLPGKRAGLGWVARFLFPGIYVYDSSLGCGADHVAALFAAPVLLLLLRALRHASPRTCLLLAVAMSGVILTKFTATFELLPFAILALVARALLPTVQRLLGRPVSPGLWKGLFLCGGAGLLFTTPFWLKNLIWYGDPVYPVLHKYFHDHPWTPDSAQHYQMFAEHFWRPARNLAGLKESAEALLTFSLDPHDWYGFHRNTPVFGSMFTLVTAALLLHALRDQPEAAEGAAGAKKPRASQRRLWVATAGIYLGIFTWYWVHHQDRFLQTMMPWMAPVTAVGMRLIWERGRIVRGVLAFAVALQLVWGGDAYAIGIRGRSAATSAASLLVRGYQRQYDQRLEVYPAFESLADTLPANAKILFHEERERVGSDRANVQDEVSHQSGIAYVSLRTPRKVYDLLRSFGVTHVYWNNASGKSSESAAGELVFHYFARYTENKTMASWGATVASMPSKPPPDEMPDAVAVFRCKGKSGYYHLADLNPTEDAPFSLAHAKPYAPLPAGEGVEPAAGSVLVAVEEKCFHDSPKAMAKMAFDLVYRRKDFTLYIAHTDGLTTQAQQQRNVGWTGKPRATAAPPPPSGPEAGDEPDGGSPGERDEADQR